MGGYHFDVFLALDSMQRRDIPVYLYHYSFIICILFFFRTYSLMCRNVNLIDEPYS